MASTTWAAAGHGADVHRERRAGLPRAVGRTRLRVVPRDCGPPGADMDEHRRRATSIEVIPPAEYLRMSLLRTLALPARDGALCSSGHDKRKNGAADAPRPGRRRHAALMHAATAGRRRSRPSALSTVQAAFAIGGIVCVHATCTLPGTRDCRATRAERPARRDGPRRLRVPRHQRGSRER